MAFNPSVIFHQEGGKTVTIQVDSSSLATLTSDSSLELNFDYETNDIDDLGQVRYVNKTNAEDEIRAVLTNKSNAIPYVRTLPNFTSPAQGTKIPYSSNTTINISAPVFTNSSITVASARWVYANAEGQSDYTNYLTTLSSNMYTFSFRPDQCHMIQNSTATKWYIWVEFTLNMNGVGGINGTSVIVSNRLVLDVSNPRATVSTFGLNTASARIGATSDESNALSYIESQVATARARGRRAAIDPREAYTVSDSKSISLDLINTHINDNDKVLTGYNNGVTDAIINLNLKGYNLSEPKELFESILDYKLSIYNVYKETSNEDEYLYSEENKGYSFLKQNEEVKVLTSEDLLCVYNPIFNRIEINNIKLLGDNRGSITVKMKLNLLNGESYTCKLPIELATHGSEVTVEEIDGELVLPSDTGCDSSFNNMVKLTTNKNLDNVNEATWSLQVYNKNSGQYVTKWSYTTNDPRLFKSLGRYSESRLPNHKVSDLDELRMVDKLHTDFIMDNQDLVSLNLQDYTNDDDINSELGLPIKDPNVVSESNGSILISLVLKDSNGTILGDYCTTLDSNKISKYKNIKRNDLFTNTVYKLPFLTNYNCESKYSYLNRRYVEPINPSSSILNPIGHESSTILGYRKLENTNIENIALTSPYSFLKEEIDYKFNILVFRDIDHLVDMIYSMSFFTESNKVYHSIGDNYSNELSNIISRRPIKLVFGNKVSDSESYKPMLVNEYSLSKEDIKNELISNGFTESNFKGNETVNRRLSVYVYSKVGVLSYPLYMESFLVSYSTEMDFINHGPDGYLNKVLPIESDLSYLEFDNNIGSSSYQYPVVKKFGNSTTLSSGVESTGHETNGYESKYYLPNYLKLFKSNFEFYGTIPFWLCTDKSLLGFKGDFVHRVEGYKEGQEVVHPVTGDLYLCIKDRPGIIGDLTKDTYTTLRHNYPVGLPTYSVLEDVEYFVKVNSVDNNYKLDKEEYKKHYKSSLPTYPAILSYLNLLVNSKTGLMFNPYTNPDLCDINNPEGIKERVFEYGSNIKPNVMKDGQVSEMNKSLFPYKYLEEYLDAMVGNKNDYEFTDTTPETETRRAKEDVKYGAWFKLKNINHNKFIYLSTRPLLWVKDRKVIARANLAHPRDNVIRVGNKFYYLRLVTDQFYPEDDCCLESTVISGIPNQTYDFTSFNNPQVINFRESLIGPTIRNILTIASKTTSVTNRDVEATNGAITLEDSLIAGNKVYSISLVGNKKDVNYFSRKGTLIYSASPFNFYLGNGENSVRILDSFKSTEKVSLVCYNIQDSIPDFEFGSSETLLGVNDIVFKDPMSCITFKASTEEAKKILGIDVWDEYSNTKTMTGIYKDESVFTYNSNLNYVNYNGNENSDKTFEDYYPVHVVLEAVDESELPIYNIKDSLSGLLNENEQSLSTVIENLGNKVSEDKKEFFLNNAVSKDIKHYVFHRLIPSYSDTGVNIPFIDNGGYTNDITTDIDYTLTSEYVSDMINFTPVEGSTPDTQFNISPKLLYDMMDRKTYGSINLEDVRLGNWGNYKTITGNSYNREIRRRSYDRWSMTGYLGTIDININKSTTKNILFTQLERIVKHRFVNNDNIRSLEKELYPVIHIFYYKTKLYLVPVDHNFDVSDNVKYGFKYNTSLDYLEYGRSKPIDNRSKDVDRVKLGCNVFDVVIPFMVNDRFLKNEQELRRKVVPIDGYVKPKE